MSQQAFARGDISKARATVHYNNKAFPIHFEHGEEGLVYGTCPQIPGLFIAASSTTEVLHEVLQCLSVLVDAQENE